MILTARFDTLPAMLNMGTYFSRAQFNFASLSGVDDMLIVATTMATGSVVNGLTLNDTGVRIDLILPTNIIKLSLGSWTNGTIDVTTIDTTGLRSIHSLACKDDFITHSINDKNIQAIEFIRPGLESRLEYISIDVDFC